VKHMANRRTHRSGLRLLGCGLAIATSLGLSGCGATDGLELNGKVFDWMGIGANSDKTRSEPQLAQRGPLVPPPTLERLPEPGTTRAPPPVLTNANWPGSDEQTRQTAQADEERKKQEYCANGGDWKGKAFNSPTKPLYDCPNLLTTMTGWFSKPAPPDAQASQQGAKPINATTVQEPPAATDQPWSTTAKPANR